MTKPTPSLKEEIDNILFEYDHDAKTGYYHLPRTITEIMDAIKQAIERAEPEKLTKFSSKTPEVNGYNQGVHDYKQRLLAEVK